MTYYLSQIWASLTQPYFYRQVILAPVGRALKYYLALSAVLALGTTLIVGIVWAPKAGELVRLFSRELVQSYPAELVITISAGRAATNQPGPHYWPWPKTYPRLSPQVEYLAVIDTDRSPETAARQFGDYQTFWLLTETDLIQLADPVGGGYQSQSLLALPYFEITRADLSRMVGQLQSRLYLLPPILAFGAFVVGYLWLLGLLLYWAFLALPVWLLFKLFGLPSSYADSFKVTLHAATLGLVVWLAWLLIPGTWPPAWTMTFLTLAAAIINLWYLRQYQKQAESLNLKKDQ